MAFSTKCFFFFLPLLFISDKFYAQSILAGQYDLSDYYFGSGVYLGQSTGPGQYLNIDINGDAIDDFELALLDSNGPGVSFDFLRIQPLNSSSEIVFGQLDSCTVSGGGYNMVHRFTDYENINSALNWQGSQSLYVAYLYDDTTNLSCQENQFDWGPQSSYVGVRLSFFPDTLYGWIYIRGHIHHNHSNMEVRDYACNLNVTGIAEQGKPEDIFYIYPNPTTNKFTVKFSTAKNSSLQIFNSFGEIVYAEKLFKKGDFTVEEHFAPGIYFVKVNDSVKKLIIE